MHALSDAPAASPKDQQIRRQRPSQMSHPNKGQASSTAPIGSLSLFGDVARMRAASMAAVEQQRCRDSELLKQVAEKVSPYKMQEVLNRAQHKACPVVPPSSQEHQQQQARSPGRGQKPGVQTPLPPHEPSLSSGWLATTPPPEEMDDLHMPPADTPLQRDPAYDDLHAAYQAELRARRDSEAKWHKAQGQVEELRRSKQELHGENASLRLEVLRLREDNRALSARVEVLSLRRGPDNGEDLRGGQCTPGVGRTRVASRGYTHAARSEGRSSTASQGSSLDAYGDSEAGGSAAWRAVASGRGREAAKAAGREDVYDSSDVERARGAIFEKMQLELGGGFLHMSQEGHDKTTFKGSPVPHSRVPVGASHQRLEAPLDPENFNVPSAFRFSSTLSADSAKKKGHSMAASKLSLLQVRQGGRILDDVVLGSPGSEAVTFVA